MGRVGVLSAAAGDAPPQRAVPRFGRVGQHVSPHRGDHVVAVAVDCAPSVPPAKAHVRLPPGQADLLIEEHPRPVKLRHQGVVGPWKTC